MKQTIINGLKLMFALVLLFSSFAMVCQGKEIPVRKYMVTACGNFFRSSQTSYRQIYGQSAFMPEIKITRLLYRGIGIWGGFGWISNNGFIEEVDEPANIRQTILSFGLGYVSRLSALLQFRGEIGLTFNSFKEEALEVTLKGSGLGWKIGVSLDYFIVKKVFVTLTTSYSQVSDEAQTGKVKLGGSQIGMGLGYTF